jgi:hypothetical protein
MTVEQSTTQAVSETRTTYKLGHRQRQARTPRGFYARAAIDSQTRRDAFRLRHTCYHSKGYIDARPDGEFSDPHDMVASNTTIVLYEDGRPLGSVRVCTADKRAEQPEARQLPLAHSFPEDLESLLGADARALEINRLVCHPAHAQSQGLVFMLMRMSVFIIQQHDPDFVISCVRSNHVGFYKRLRFEHVAGPRPYAGLKFTTNFLACRREKFGMLRRVVPALRISEAEGQVYAGMMRGEAVPVFAHA